MFTYTIHTAPHNSTLSFHSSNEYVGRVCRFHVHIASYFPVAYAYYHQRPNSWDSNFLAKYTCCPALHRSCCLFWFCVIIYCLQREPCSFKEKKVWLMFSSQSMHNEYCQQLSDEMWLRPESQGPVCVFQGSFHSQRGRGETWSHLEIV